MNKPSDACSSLRTNILSSPLPSKSAGLGPQESDRKSGLPEDSRTFQARSLVMFLTSPAMALEEPFEAWRPVEMHKAGKKGKN